MSKTIKDLTFTLESQNEVTMINNNFLNITINSLFFFSKLIHLFLIIFFITNNNGTPYILDREIQSVFLSDDYLDCKKLVSNSIKQVVGKFLSKQPKRGP